MAQRFKFGGRIGSGGFGVVSHATRLDDGTPFAVKQLVPRLVEEEEAVRRFRREVRLQRALQHPNVLPIVAANLAANPPWYVMPIMERTLFLEGQTGLSESEVERLFKGILEGVEYAHSNNVIHRDLKPENVLITHDGIPQISDFGLGKNLLSNSTELTETTVGMGSFPYVAPEQMESAKTVDERADVFALGKILQFMLTGQVPIAPPEKVVPVKYRYFIQRCCDYSADERYQSVAEVRKAFEQVVRGSRPPRPVQEVIPKLLARWRNNADADAVRELLELLEVHKDDASLYMQLVPTLEDDVIGVALQRYPQSMRAVVDAYDSYVDRPGSLDFSYCDVVANFYRRLYTATDDLQLRKLLLTRLLSVGRSHNRWHVGDVVAAILSEAKETSEVMMVVDVLSDHSEDARWFRPNPILRGADLAPPIDEAMFGRQH